MPANTGLCHGNRAVIDEPSRSHPPINPTAPPYADTATNPAKAVSQA
jgi:hypothetical protein